MKTKIESQQQDEGVGLLKAAMISAQILAYIFAVFALSVASDNVHVENNCPEVKTLSAPKNDLWKMAKSRSEIFADFTEMNVVCEKENCAATRHRRLRGPRGPRGFTGPAGPQGFPGPTGPVGPAGPSGEPGADGAAGPDGQNGLPGVDGAEGPRGPEGQEGPAGLDGLTGPAGRAGDTPLLGYFYIYNTGAQTVQPGSPVTFSTLEQSSSEFSFTLGGSAITINRFGFYELRFSVSSVEPSQFSVYMNGANIAVAGGRYGSGAANQQNTGQVLFVGNQGTVITIRNDLSAGPITLQTNAGGTAVTVNASVSIVKIA